MGFASLTDVVVHSQASWRDIVSLSCDASYGPVPRDRPPANPEVLVDVRDPEPLIFSSRALATFAVIDLAAFGDTWGPQRSVTPDPSTRLVRTHARHCPGLDASWASTLRVELSGHLIALL